MTIREAQNLFQRMDRQVGSAVESGLQGVLDRGLAIARQESSGPYSLAELARMDYPYARRHGSPLLDAAKINKQKGEFAGSWFTAGKFGAGGGSGQIINDDPKADMLEAGTRVMFPRRIGASVEKKLAVEAEWIVDSKVSRVLSRYA